MPNRCTCLLLRSAAILLCQAAVAADPPRVLDTAWQIERIAAEPDLVTPVGCCFDESGRLFVVECHTHFPPDDYDGPEVDRIYVWDDTDGDDVVDRQRLFFAGGTATMGVTSLGDGWIAVASRSEVIRLRDQDLDGKADQRERLLVLETEESYPHDGLAGLAKGPDGLLYVGQGENLGAPYALIGSDGSKQVGGGEGGNIFRCTTDGAKLQRVATGFWNPFGIHFDAADRLWTVGNDPDAMPPCRLLHVVPGGDYGFQFRFGRAGTHPLQSWDGEFPGTLPMAAGMGEAPCAVVSEGDRLWATSWGDNRIERYRLKPHGATLTSETEVVVQGDATFRPAGMAVAPDGSIYFTDWVDRSYPVHGKGRLWRLSRKTNDSPPTNDPLELSQDERRASSLRGDASVSRETRLEGLEDDDPFIHQAASYGLANGDQLQRVGSADALSPRQRVGIMSAWRWRELASPASVSRAMTDPWITRGLQDDSDEVVLAAIRWATEREATEHLPAIRKLLSHPVISQRRFAATIASIAYLETGSASRGRRDPVREQLLLDFASDADRPAKVRALAIRMLPVESDQPTDAQLRSWLSERDDTFSLEIVRLLSSRKTPTSLEQLADIAGDESLSPQIRADAVAGLSRNAGDFASVLNKLARPGTPDALRQETMRVLRPSWRGGQSQRPRRDDLDAWDQLIGSGGDERAGRRVFARTTCSNCHAHNGRGAKTGPDLTTISGRMTSKRLLESILDPSKEVGPLYVPWRVLTVDGNVLTGLKLDASGVGNSLRFQGADGMTFEVPLSDIEAQDPIEQSIMPSGLEDTLSTDELRDLVAFLIGPS